MVNRRADIFLENEDGTSEEYVTPDMAPFDLSSGHLDVPDEDYGVWYVDLMDATDRYDGLTVKFKALMCHSKKYKGVHCPGRFAMVCCEDDMQFLALVCKGEGLEKFKDRAWVEITATVSCDGRTGVEMEALTAVSTAALTVYDMCKAVQKDMVISDIRLISKTGGVHGDYYREEEK